MNLNKKVEAQERRIKLLEDTVKSLREENKDLTIQNKELLGIIDFKNVQIESAEEMKTEFEKCIEEARKARARYKEAYQALVSTRSDYEHEVKRLLRSLKKDAK